MKAVTSEIHPERELLEYAGKGGNEIYQLYFHVNARFFFFGEFSHL